MFILCSLYAPVHQNKFQVGVNLLGNKYNSDSDKLSYRSYSINNWQKINRIVNGLNKNTSCFPFVLCLLRQHFNLNPTYLGFDLMKMEYKKFFCSPTQRR